MAITHNLGFPRIGKHRELKFALEKYWSNAISQDELLQTATTLRKQNWKNQNKLDWVPVGDFSFYDQVLDMSFLLGNVPKRAKNLSDNELNNYFRVARGRVFTHESDCTCIQAGEMTKWFDTNYHYIVPEFNKEINFTLQAEHLIAQIRQAQEEEVKAKPVVIGPVTYLWLGKSKDKTNKLDLLDSLVKVYVQLFDELAKLGIEWIQIDEPILVTELEADWQVAFRKTYDTLASKSIKLLLTSYFGTLQDNLNLACGLPIDGLHIDAINAQNEVPLVIDGLPDDKVLSLGVVNGRNIWKTDLNATLLWLEPIHQQLQDRLWLAPSCSLLHVPVDLDSEQELSGDIKSWLGFAVQKLKELRLLAQVLNQGQTSATKEIANNIDAINARKYSSLVHNSAVKERTAKINDELGNRQSNYKNREKLQSEKFNLPLYPTTTIGSFPQTLEIRKARHDYKLGELSTEKYMQMMQTEIQHCVQMQENLGLDVLVHGEPERNDMVEYFGQQLGGYAFSQFGWVQSYGSRCVKPPIIFGDISRLKPMTLDWITYAQSLTNKPMKGMLTGPVTMLNWSFVRDDQPRATTCLQLSLAIRDEVLDLEKSNINIIQIDEAALREGLPLRKSQWKMYLDWAIRAYRISANGVSDGTQIHTHMCYSEFNDIIEAIAQMDADVITIETSRSDMKLLNIFDKFNYPNAIGPGVYDIHSPNIPSVSSMVKLMQKAAKRIPSKRLWVNPDCGLKTRHWDEVNLALTNMVLASQQLRKN